MVQVQRLALTSLLLVSTTAIADARRLKKAKAGKTPKSTDTCSAEESGYEVWQKRPNESVNLKLTSEIDTDTCMYKLSLSFTPDPEIPYLSDTTLDDFLGEGTNPDFQQVCASEGLYAVRAPDTSPLSPENHVGLQEYYTDYAFSLDVPKKSQKKVGFKLATLGASPCGTWLQPFPQYSVHFYTIDTDFRRKMTCKSGGDYFCTAQTDQCSESGRKFNMDGAGIPTCDDAPPGPPQYQNVPQGYFWTVDGSLATGGLNAATPAMGLHSIDPSEFAPTRSRTIPYLLMLNYDKEVIGNHVLIWSGFANGEGTEAGNSFSKETPSYNCQTEDKNFLPTLTTVDYVDGATVTSISGPLTDCSGPSFTQAVNSVRSKKAKGAPKTPKAPKAKKSTE